MLRVLFECNCCGDKFVVEEEVNSLNELSEPKCTNGCSGSCELIDIDFVGNE